MVDLFETYFWETATAFTTLIVPVLAMFFVFRIVHDLLWGK